MTMNIVLTSIAFLASALCAGIMGFAIQRGATCTVAAVDEFVNKRRLRRLASMGEASLWVLGGLLIANAWAFWAQCRRDTRSVRQRLPAVRFSVLAPT